jgi:hypothetical protein
MPDLDSDFWDELFAFIKSDRVVPILGPELLQVEVDGVRRPYLAEVADRLADRLRIGRPVGADNSLDDVARRYIDSGGKRAEIFKKIHLIVNELSVVTPVALKKLARIEHFRLYVSLSFDTLLVRAINEERFRGKALTSHLAYALNRADDLPTELARLQTPVVYSLFGRHTVAPDYVVTEEDTLEFVSSLQSENRRPQLLFDELERCNLLLLGCSLPDWLARFFIRTAKSRPLSMNRDEWEYWVNPKIDADKSLVLFLDRFSKSTKRIAVDPLTFIDQMEHEWSARYLVPRASVGADAIDPVQTAAQSDSPAVFISYARQDTHVAQQLNAALCDAGIEVWFDQQRLEGGDLYETRIRNSIDKCTLFVPLVSRHTELRAEGFFRREWRWADIRRQGIADAIPFIVPIGIDIADPNRALVPESFKSVHWIPLADRSPESTEVQRIRTLIREHVKRRQTN